MDQLSEKKQELLSGYLLQLCHEYGVFSPEMEQCHPHDDLIEGGFVDSMGLVYLQGVISDKFALELEPALFIAELRTIQSIADYLAKQLPLEWFNQNQNGLLITDKA